MGITVNVSSSVDLNDVLDELSVQEKRELLDELRNELKNVQLDADGKERIVERDPANALDDMAERELTAKLEQIKDLRPKFVFKRILCNVFRLGYYEDDKLRELLSEFITAR